mmetsp:Transcript_8092/g.36804  ORF Transcript_8092/g.36804 Transcript_8092/m.36804 type:complete len:701 (+) Transcript_8092:1365-3467(+)
MELPPSLIGVEELIFELLDAIVSRRDRSLLRGDARLLLGELAPYVVDLLVCEHQHLVTLLLALSLRRSHRRNFGSELRGGVFNLLGGALRSLGARDDGSLLSLRELRGGVGGALDAANLLLFAVELRDDAVEARLVLRRAFFRVLHSLVALLVRQPSSLGGAHLSLTHGGVARVLGLSVQLGSEHGERRLPVLARGLFELEPDASDGGVPLGGGLHGELVGKLGERSLVSALSLRLQRLDLDVGGGLEGGAEVRDCGGDRLRLLRLKLRLERRLLALERSLLLLLREVERGGLGLLAAALQHLELRLERGGLLLRGLLEQLSLELGQRLGLGGSLLVADLPLERLNRLRLVLDESFSLGVERGLLLLLGGLLELASLRSERGGHLSRGGFESLDARGGRLGECLGLRGGSLLQRGRLLGGALGADGALALLELGGLLGGGGGEGGRGGLGGIVGGLRGASLGSLDRDGDVGGGLLAELLVEVVDGESSLLIGGRQGGFELSLGGGAHRGHSRRVCLLSLHGECGALLLERSLHLGGGDGQGGLLVRGGCGAEGRLERLHSLALIPVRRGERRGHLRRELRLERGDRLGVRGGRGGERSLLVGERGSLGVGDSLGTGGGGGGERARGGYFQLWRRGSRFVGCVVRLWNRVDGGGARGIQLCARRHLRRDLRRNFVWRRRGRLYAGGVQVRSQARVHARRRR